MKTSENTRDTIDNSTTLHSAKRNTGTETYNFDIIGMTCNGCANSIKSYLRKLDGVDNADVNFASENAEIKYDPAKINRDYIKKAVKNLGYEISGDDDEYETELVRTLQLKKQKTKIITSIVLSLFIMAISMQEHIPLLNLFHISETVFYVSLFVLTSVVIFWCGNKFLKGALTSLKNKSSDMNTLIALGSMSAYLYSVVITINVLFELSIAALSNAREVYFETSAMIITFILIGNFLEAILKTKTQTSIKKLKDLQAKVVNVIRDGVELFIPFNKVRLEDIVLIKTGEKIPVDGLIIDGFCVVDESAMTGESLPIEKYVGDRLISGTILRNGFIKLKAEKVGKDTMLSKIILLVKDASNKKPKIQKLADRISAVFVPIVIFISIVTFVVWFFVIGEKFDQSLLFAVSVLIIACPCALGLASPMAIVIGVGRAAENGILFNNVDAIENLVKVDTICFDKTGTLTTGEMRVKNVFVLNGISKDELIKYVYSVEKFSNHPIAKSIINFGIDHNILPEKNVTEFNNESGFGVSAKVNNKVMYIGSESFMKNKNIPLSNAFVHADKNNLFVSIDNKIAGIIEVEDKIKDEAKMVVKKLKDKKYNLFMISGDNEGAAKKTARELSIDNYSYRTLPDEKEKIISKLQSENKNVAMIGDGINDAPSLARANVGIAVGTGQDIAIDSADLILVKGDLNNILKSIKLSDKTVSVIKENFFWAFFYNIIAIPFAAGVFVPYGIIVSPIVAAMLMAFSDVITVIVNSLRLKYVKIN